jgi:hypothetical protein
MKNVLLALILAAGAFSTTVYAEVVCFDDGTCIDIGDIGIHP